MTPTVIAWTAAGIILTAALTYAAHLALHATARRLEQFLAEALDHDYLADIDDEYRTLVEEGA